MIKSILIMVVLASSTMLALPFSNSTYASAQPDLFPPSVSKSLSVKWWQWLLSIPTNDSPINGDNPCDLKQSGPFFYLVGTFGGEAVSRTCTVPEGKAIFFPVINVIATVDENDPAFDTLAKTKQQAKEFIDGATDLQVSLDGTNIEVDNLRVQSQQFKVRVGEDNQLGAPPGTYVAVSDGYWVALKPLSAGEHELHFSGSIGEFSVDVTYTLIVQ
jgi:hypothetical protein